MTHTGPIFDAPPPRPTVRERSASVVSRCELRHRARDRDLVERAPLDPVGDRAGVFLLAVRAVLRVHARVARLEAQRAALSGAPRGRDHSFRRRCALTRGEPRAQDARVSCYARRSSSRSARVLASLLIATEARANDASVAISASRVRHARQRSRATVSPERHSASARVEDGATRQLRCARADSCAPAGRAPWIGVRLAHEKCSREGARECGGGAPGRSKRRGVVCRGSQRVSPQAPPEYSRATAPRDESRTMRAAR